jgi:uncharacterized protein DUF4124/SmpA/OmlA family protein
MSGSMRVFLLPLALLAFGSAALAEQIYVCKGSDGKVVYRDFPCPSDAESTAYGDPKTSDAKSVKSQKPASDQELRPGMSKNEVRSILGSPTEITQEEGVDGRVDTWSYGAGLKTLQFDAAGHLIK